MKTQNNEKINWAMTVLCLLQCFIICDLGPKKRKLERDLQTANKFFGMAIKQRDQAEAQEDTTLHLANEAVAIFKTSLAQKDRLIMNLLRLGNSGTDIIQAYIDGDLDRADRMLKKRNRFIDSLRSGKLK